MYIPIITFPQSVARSVLKNFVRDIIAFDEKPRSNRAKIECIDWYYPKCIYSLEEIIKLLDKRCQDVYGSEYIKDVAKKFKELEGLK